VRHGRNGQGAFEVPPKLLGLTNQPGGRKWLDRLPATVEALARQWSVEVGEPFLPGGNTAWVAPARTRQGGEVVLKVAWPHYEAEHEIEGLKTWSGDGTVLLLAGERLRGSVALLLERCQPGNTLAEVPMELQDEVIAGLLRRLWREPPPGHPFRPLSQMCGPWASSYEAKAAEGKVPPIDPGLASEAMALMRSLSLDGSSLLLTDLHAGNVLVAEREPWLAIDPKPYVGDPAYDVVQHMLNCEERLRDNPVGLARRMAALAGLDEGRVLLWLFARCVEESPNSPYLAGVARALAPR
jgi:streptomycin 6-kinase